MLFFKNGMCLFFVLCIFFFTCTDVNADTSSQLIVQRTETTSGYRLDYVDGSGSVTMAEDKGYSTVIYEVKDGHCVAEHYFDEEMNPVSPNQYNGVLYEYTDGYCSKVTFVDESNKPTMNTRGYSIRLQTANELGQITKEIYVDTESNPVAISGGYSGIQREKFDSNGRVILYSYLDKNGDFYYFNDRYCTIRCSYDEAGYVSREFYFDEKGDSITNDEGVYGIEYIRDENGTDIGYICLSSDGEKIESSYGYTIVFYERNKLSYITSFSYFDAYGNPIELSRGQHTEVREFDGNELVCVYYLDKNGNKVFKADLFLQQHIVVNFVIAIMVILIVFFSPRWIKLLILSLYIMFIIYLTLYIREFHPTSINIDLIGTYAKFLTSSVSRREILNNVALFIPIGGIIYSLWNEKTPGFLVHLCGNGGRNMIPIVLLIVMLFSASIEVIQLVTGLGAFELSDFVDNVVGGAIGILIYHFFVAILRKKITNST